MKKTKLLSILIISFFNLGVLFTACEKTDDDVDPEITNEVIHAKTGEIVQVVTETSLAEGDYDAIIGEELTTVRIFENNVIFLIPDMESGEYELSATIADRAITVELVITKSVAVENPDEYLTSLNTGLEDYILANIQDVESQLEAGLIDSVQANTYIANWHAYEGNFAAELEELTDEEKQSFANFIKVNRVWIDELIQFGGKKASNGENADCIWLKEQAKKAKVDERHMAFSWFTMRWNHCKAENTPEAPSKLGEVNYSFSLNFSWMESIWNSYVEPIFENVEQSLDNLNRDMVAEEIEDSKKLSSFTFVNNIPQNIVFNIKFRSVNESDINSGSSFTGVATNIDSFIKFVASLSTEIANFFNIDFGFTNTSTTVAYNRDMEIKNITNSNVSLLSSEIVEDDWEVAFTTTEAEDQEFSFDLTYDDGNTQVSKTFNAIIETLEPYSIEILSGNNQSGELGEMLEEPIEVLVKDEEGNPFENALVTFEVSEGIVSFEQTTTNEDGIAFTYWSLGTYNDEQQLIAKAFKSDGVTEVEGSPVVFSADGNPCNNNTAPNIISVNRVCDEDDIYTIFYDIQFSADGTGFDPSGTYSGVPYPGTYPVRLEFLTAIGDPWSHASNSYNVTLLSGDFHNGVIRLGIQMGQPLTCADQGNGILITFHESWRIKLIDDCELESNYSNEFDVTYWTY